MTISNEPELITPQIAADWLSRNAGNRKLSPAHVRFLADQILTGQWKLTPDTIKISDQGRLLDGQHRLSAIVEANQAQQLYIARDCDESIFTVLDTGKSRSAADVVAISGLKNPTTVAAIARLIILHRTDQLVALSGKKRTASNGEVLAICQELDLEPVASYAFTLYQRARFLSQGEYGFLFWMFCGLHSQEAVAFLDALSIGANLAADSPILALRRKLEQARNGDRFKFLPIERLALTIKAWNLFRAQKPTTLLYYNSVKEKFPEAI